MRNLKNLALLAMLSLMTMPAHASMIETPEILSGSEPAPAFDFLKRQAVEQRFLESGVEPEESKRRVQRMTDAEIAHVHARLDELPVGQGVSTTNLLLIIIILILLL